MWTSSRYVEGGEAVIYSDHDIQERLEDDLVIEPLDDPDTQIQPASVDLRLGNEFLTPTESMIPVDPKEETPPLNEVNSDYIILKPDDFALATTVERVEIPPDIMGKVQGRSSIGRMGIQIHATAGVCDPGFRGEITLELSNVGKTPVTLHSGMRIAQLVLHELKSESVKPYGSCRNSKYQEQSGAKESKIEDDSEFG